jgi:hypothetical protein
MRGFLTVVLLLVAFSAFGQFRDTTWGMGHEQVVQAEGRESDSVSPGGMLYYNVILFELEAQATYMIDEEWGLHFAAYIIPGRLFPRVFEIIEQRYIRAGRMSPRILLYEHPQGHTDLVFHVPEDVLGEIVIWYSSTAYDAYKAQKQTQENLEAPL